MPKKKQKKQPFEYGYIIYGIVLILASIIGFGKFGIIGRLIAVMSIFLVGFLYQFLLILLTLTGLYIIFKGDTVKIFQKKLIGLYMLFLSILILAHLSFLEGTDISGFSIITNVFGNFSELLKDTSSASGGGIIGAILTAIFLPLFDTNGATIISWTLLVCGFLLFTGMNIVTFIKKIHSMTKKLFTKTEVANTIEVAEKKFEEDNKIVISSVEDLKHHEEKEEEKEETEVVETNKGYRRPPLALLQKPEKQKNEEDHDYIKSNIQLLEGVFNDFGIIGKIVAVNIGPSVTQYEVELKSGTKVSKILSMHREISLALAAKDVRIQGPIPGKRTIGIELANKHTTPVTVREILEKAPKELQSNKLLVTLGKDIMGTPVYCEINNTPHLLVAGATGSGKSVCINSIIVSILMRTKPDEVKLILVDPKKVELTMYNGVPHLLTPVVTDPAKANIALKKLVVEMERRYEIFSEVGAKNIAGYNAYIEKKQKTEEVQKLPYIVAIIDELADLMLVAAKEVEDSIMRITQMARAAGIHLIVATQRPSTDVITGLIKSNIPSRISFAVSSSIDSRTILDMSGAEKLLGKGDMLFLPMGQNTPVRVQGTYISEEEIKSVVDHTISQQKAKYDESLLIDDEEKKAITGLESDEEYEDPMYDEIVQFVVEQQKASASLIQRRFRLGYNRAARVIDLLEERGIIGPNNGSKPRDVLVKFENKE